MVTPPVLARPIRRVRHFEILQEIGQGGMGVVYLARQPVLDRLVVLKKIRRDLLADASVIERFQREARAAAAVHHQNIVAVHDCFDSRGDHYIAQEYVDGLDLSSAIAGVGLDPRVAALIALEVARGLEEIHAQGVVHRDLKPANILIGRGGDIKIADFGIALESRADGLTRPGVVIGSVPYMSPEQMMGERVDYRSDLFLFGILLYEMLAGAAPFQESAEDDEDTLLERMQQSRYESLRRLGVRAPRYLSRIISVCLRPKPAQRIQATTQLRRHLERRLRNISPAESRREIADYLGRRGLVEPQGGVTKPRPLPSTPPATGWRRLGRPAWLASAGAALVLAVAALAAWHFGGESESTVAPAAARQLPAEALPPPGRGEPSAAALAAMAPAEVRFVAYPWAEVRIDDQPGFLTPRAAPVQLAPGRHQVTFRHERYGEARLTLQLSAGEQRLVRHVFEEAPGP